MDPPGDTGKVCPQAAEAPDYMRAEAWLHEFRREAMQRGTMGSVMEAVARGLKAKTTVRSPDPSSARGWSYVWHDDGAVQLTAARLAMAYLAGNPPTQADIRISGGTTGEGANGKLTVAQRLEELRAIGVTLESVVESIRRETGGAMVDVTPAK